MRWLYCHQKQRKAGAYWWGTGVGFSSISRTYIEICAWEIWWEWNCVFSRHHGRRNPGLSYFFAAPTACLREHNMASSSAVSWDWDELGSRDSVHAITILPIHSPSILPPPPPSIAYTQVAKFIPTYCTITYTSQAKDATTIPRHPACVAERWPSCRLRDLCVCTAWCGASHFWGELEWIVYIIYLFQLFKLGS